MIRHRILYFLWTNDLFLFFDVIIMMELKMELKNCCLNVFFLFLPQLE